jgi:hypothetical protein
VADDALALDRGADHEAGHVGEEQQRQAERVAQPDEVRGLVGRVDEEHAALLLGLVGDDADRPAVEAREADDELLGPARVDLEERLRVDERVDELLDVERLVLVGGDEVADRRRRCRLGRRRDRAGPPPSATGSTTASAWRRRCPPRRS